MHARKLWRIIAIPKYRERVWEKETDCTEMLCTEYLHTMRSRYHFIRLLARSYSLLAFIVCRFVVARAYTYTFILLWIFHGALEIMSSLTLLRFRALLRPLPFDIRDPSRWMLPFYGDRGFLISHNGKMKQRQFNSYDKVRQRVTKRAIDTERMKRIRANMCKH